VNKEIAYYLGKIFSKAVKSIVVKENSVIVNIEPLYLEEYCSFIKKHANLKLNTLLDVWVVDYPEEENRFEISYYFLSVQFNIRIVVRCNIPENEVLPSLLALFKSAGWLEREVWDMFGIFFENNGDLRRILTDYGFEGYPLRKDFPLMGYVEIRYDDGFKRVIIEPVEMSQEYRVFEFVSPWEKSIV
jgi:NADH/F420H2 dehydrogenase subunit C